MMSSAIALLSRFKLMFVLGTFWTASISNTLPTQVEPKLCIEDIERGVYNCNNIPLVVLPSKSIPSNTKVLLLANSNLNNSIPPLASVGLVNLVTLDLSNNHISSFDDNLFTNLTSLRYLDIRGNKVLATSPLPGGVFSSLHHLETLKVTISQIAVTNVEIFLEESMAFRHSLKQLCVQQGDLSIGVYIASQFRQLNTLVTFSKR